MRRIASEIWSEGNLDVIDELFAEEYVGHATPAPDEVRGPEGYKEFVGTYREAFPDFSVELMDVMATDDRAVARYTVRGTHEGTLRGKRGEIEPTGRKIELPGVVMMRFEDGRCVEEWNYGDTMEMMEQLGVMPEPR